MEGIHSTVKLGHSSECIIRRSYLGNECTNGVFVQKVFVVLPNLVLLHNLLLLHSVARFYYLASRSINNPSRCEDESAEQTQQWVFALD